MNCPQKKPSPQKKKGKKHKDSSGTLKKRIYNILWMTLYLFFSSWVGQPRISFPFPHVTVDIIFTDHKEAKP